LGAARLGERQNLSPCFTSSLAVKEATSLLKPDCCSAAAQLTVVLCVLLLFFPLLFSVAPPVSLASAYFCCTVGNFFNFALQKISKIFLLLITKLGIFPH